MALFIGVAHAATEAAGHGGESGATGLPQLDPAVYAPQIFWLLVALVVLYLLMSRIALPRIGQAIEDRHDAIEDDLDRAADLKRKAEDAEKAYDKALAQAKAEATRIADAAKAEVQKKIDAATAEADERIAAKTRESEARIAEIRDGAMASVQQVATETAEALVEALAPETADAEAVRDAVSRRMEA